MPKGRITDDVKTVMNMVRKDVLRTDRQHGYYAGEGNHNVTSLFNILTTYALNHPSVSYCQVLCSISLYRSKVAICQCNKCTRTVP